ncbi:MAG: hypothetical protein IPI46_12355 [Bacteroidetes bacterium]|nr:hypothetical protein [Bacteroidota bacterium]
MYLKEDNQIELPFENLLNNPYYYLELKNIPFKGFQIPRACEYGGVYFYFGFNKNDISELHIYVGKASQNSTMGKRLYSHFYQRFSQTNFEGHNYYFNNDILIEGMLLLPIENNEHKFLAPSMEEFIITDMKEKNYLLINKVGNS